MQAFFLNLLVPLLLSGAHGFMFEHQISIKKTVRRPHESLSVARRRAEHEKTVALYARELARRNNANGRVSFRECQLSEGEREDCGYFGITEHECYSRGCCWGQTQAIDVPWCYHSIATMLPQCVMDVVERVECGSYGIRKETCLAQGCCWQPTQQESAPWCFHYYKEPLFPGECGVPSVHPNVVTRIVGGVEATPHSWPWTVSLRRDGNHFCGGSLLNSQWVLTAAHCEPGYERASVRTAVLGNHFNSQTDPYEVEVEVTEMLPHPNYSDATYDSDIMLLKLAEPVVMSEGVSPVCLPPEGHAYQAGQNCYTMGWGVTQWMGISPETLQQVLVPLIGRDVCNGEDWYGGRITPNMLCAGYEEGGRDSCQGDSGGPLVCYNHEDENWMLTGVVSWGEKCAYERSPGIYANVAMLQRWIVETVSDYS